MIAIIGAMDGEIKEILTHTDMQQSREWNGFQFHTGLFENKKVVVAKGGVGKVMIAMLTQKLIDEYAPEMIIFTGIAGALNPELEVGDIVVARDCMQHDLDATALGFKRGEVPYSPHYIQKTDETLYQIAMRYAPDGHNVKSGRILTGDQFITTASTQQATFLRDKLGGDAIEMEGASLGLVSELNEIPFLIIRTISDKADKKAHVDFSKFLPEASKANCQMLRHIFQLLS